MEKVFYGLTKVMKEKFDAEEEFCRYTILLRYNDQDVYQVGCDTEEELNKILNKYSCVKELVI